MLNNSIFERVKNSNHPLANIIKVFKKPLNKVYFYQFAVKYENDNPLNI